MSKTAGDRCESSRCGGFSRAAFAEDGNDERHAGQRRQAWKLGEALGCLFARGQALNRPR
jgi:hypothetical protein